MGLPATLYGLLVRAAWLPPRHTVNNPLMVNVAKACTGDPRLFEVVIFIYVQVEDGIEVDEFLITGVRQGNINFSI